MSNWQAQTGTLYSTPKLTTIKGDDNLCLVYRNMGNNHSYPFIWSDTITHSGTETLVASGIKFHGMSLVTSGNIVATPSTDPGAGVSYWIDKNVTTDVVSIKSSAGMDNVDFDIIFMLGADADVSTLYCRGNTGASQSLP